MTLTDTGPLVALLDETDKFHDQVIRTAQLISWPLVTTEACIVEAAYLHNDRGVLLEYLGRPEESRKANSIAASLESEDSLYPRQLNNLTSAAIALFTSR